MPLTDLAIRRAQPTDRPVKILDSDGLYLLLSPNGSRLWRFKYRFGGREKLLSFGVYPDVPLKLARDRRDEARRLIAAGADPSAKRRTERLAQSETFEAVARKWLDLQGNAIDGRTFEMHPTEQGVRAKQSADSCVLSLPRRLNSSRLQDRLC